MHAHEAFMLLQVPKPAIKLAMQPPLHLVCHGIVPPAPFAVIARVDAYQCYLTCCLLQSQVNQVASTLLGAERVANIRKGDPALQAHQARHTPSWHGSLIARKSRHRTGTRSSAGYKRSFSVLSDINDEGLRKVHHPPMLCALEAWRLLAHCAARSCGTALWSAQPFGGRCHALLQQ